VKLVELSGKLPKKKRGSNMANPAKTAGQIKSQIAKFSAKVSRGLDKPKRKFINEMIYGIQASKDVKLVLFYYIKPR